MLTLRSSFIVAASVWLLFMSIMQRHEAMALICLASLIWVLLEWILFQRIMFASGKSLLDCVRSIDGSAEEIITMVADRTYQVRLRGKFPARAVGYRLVIRDTVPVTFNVDKGQAYQVIDCSRKSDFELDYEIQTPICGKMVFPGIQLEISDFWGFFRTEQFVPVSEKATVLPFLIRPQTTVSVLKHNNLQRHIGHHRNRSSGVSSELLGIRDYRVGDPPRTIAWKPTARLGKLMTCEFESEVPIRATIICDLAAYQFQGRPGPSPADRAIMAAASIAKLLLADRDPVAAILLRTESAMRVNHGSGERQLTRILQYLLASSNPNPSLHHLDADNLVQIVFENASRRFPQLFDEQFNYGPARGRWLGLRGNVQYRQRRSLAVVLEHLFSLEAGMSTRMQFDDEAMRAGCLQYINRFVVVSDATSLSFELPWEDPGRWREACHRTTQSLCDHLTDARHRAIDNELYVLIAPEPVDYKGLEMVENAVKTAIAARHRVIFVAPSVPAQNSVIHDPVAERILAANDHRGLSSTDSELQWRLTALGAEFARIEDPDLMQIVAMQIGLLQSGKHRGKSSRGRA